MKEKVYAILSSLFENGRIRSIRPNEKRPYGFSFLSGNGTNGEVRYCGVDYVYAIVNNQLKVMTSAQAGWNWSETIYKQ